MDEIELLPLRLFCLDHAKMLHTNSGNRNPEAIVATATRLEEFALGGPVMDASRRAIQLAGGVAIGSDLVDVDAILARASVYRDWLTRSRLDLLTAHDGEEIKQQLSSLQAEDA